MKKKLRNSNWLKDAEYRIKNRKWLGYSSNIARRILAGIRDKQETERDFSQKTVSEKIGVSEQYISKVAKGGENLSLKTIAKFSEALGMELIEFPEYRYSKMKFPKTVPDFKRNFYTIELPKTRRVVNSSGTHATSEEKQQLQKVA